MHDFIDVGSVPDAGGKRLVITVAVMVVVVALGAALWTELGDDGSPTVSNRSSTSVKVSWARSSCSSSHERGAATVGRSRGSSS